MNPGSIEEFLLENMSRAFPIEENDPRLDSSEIFTLPNNLVVDFRGFSRNKPIEGLRPRISSVTIGELGGELVVATAAGPGEAEESLTFAIPQMIENEVIHLHSKIDNAANPDGTSSLAWGVLSLAGPFPGDIAYGTYTMLSYLEPSVFTNLWRGSLTSLTVGGTNVYGNVVFSEGYNMQIRNLGYIELTALRGAGLGVPTPAEWEDVTGDTLPGLESSIYLEECASNVSTINGIAPDADGLFTFYGSEDIEIVPRPETHQIEFKISSPEKETYCAPLTNTTEEEE